VLTTSDRRVEMVRNLLHPDSVTIIGASPKPGGWPESVFRNLVRFDYPNPVYLVNPRYDELWDVPCYPDLGALPGKPDHMVVLVPSAAVPGVLRSGAVAGARSATVYSGGFGEGGDHDGAALAETLREVVESTGLAISGPNCLGNLSAPARMVTLTERQLGVLGESNVAIVGQSGGVVLYLNKALQSRGVPVQYAVTTGNEVGLTMADYLAYCARDPEIRVVAAFIESIRDPEGFFAACEQARESGTVIVALKVGASEDGRAAAMAHTGALAGSIQAFDAVCKTLGVVRVDNIDEIVEAVEFFSHATVPAAAGVGSIVHSGGLRELLLDSASRLGIKFPPLSAESVRQLNELLPVGCYVGNPLDSGFGGLSSAETYFKCIDILLADPNIGVLLAQEALPKGAEDARAERYIRGLNELAATEARKPVAIFTMVSDGPTAYGGALRREMANIPVLQEIDRTLKTVRRAILHCEQAAAPRAQVAESRGSVPPIPEASRLAGGRQALNEVRSKEVLAQYGVPLLPEELASDPSDAVAAAERIGYPVVVKGVAGSVTHKSDLGLVELNLGDADAVAAAAEEVVRRARAAGVELEGLLVVKQGPKGLEVVVGGMRDPEVGPVVMFGAGGVQLELYGDVAFAAVPVSLDQARDLIGETRVGQVLAGYRGGPRYDIDAVASVIVAVGELMAGQDYVAEVDINPFLALGEGDRGYALDGVVVLDGGRES
jgi:acyl-CoA synthetase (NDP forming)